MDTLLIVEDERSIQEHLKSLVRESGVPIDVIMECGDGETALEIVKKYRVDVMLVDIDIPKMNGVELVQCVQALPHAPLVIVVSNSDDLQYVIQMMRCNVQEYLLKPVGAERLTGVLHVLEKKVQEDRERRQRTSLFTMRMMFSLLLDQELSEGERTLFQQIYEPMIEQIGYVVCAFHAGAKIREKSKLLLYRQSPDGALCILEENHLLPFLRSELPGAAVGISATHYTTDEMYLANEEARAARALAFCRGESVYYGTNPKAMDLLPDKSALVSDQARSQRLQLLGTNRSEELTVQWSELFRAAKTGSITLEQLIAELHRFLEDLPKVYQNALDAEDLRVLDRCSHPLAFISLAEYERFFMVWLLSLHEKITAQQEMNLNQARITQAIAYIQQNYAKDLNMAVVSNHVSMNYTLFSHYFKLQTGVSFVNYLKQVRVHAAQRLLAETDMKVIDISRKVGYINEKNFMKVFRSVTGVSPSEYRRNMNVI